MPIAGRQGLTIVAAGLLLLQPAARSGEPSPAQRAAVELDEVLVTGERPGPAMWKVSKGDHTLWIMGTLEPVPRRMTWRQKRAEEVIATSGEILADSKSSWDLDVGFWEGVGLLRSALRLKNNADGSTLREALPAGVYQRWEAAHLRWFGKKADPKERWRPIYAAIQLYERALGESGLTRRPLVWPTVERLARQHKVKIRQREFEQKVEDPKGMLEELKELPLEQETACLIQAMDYIDRELPQMRRRAQAWAIGDIAALRELPPGDPEPECMDLGKDTQLRKLVEEQQALFRKDWSGIVDWMLLAHQTSFTTLSIAELLDDKGPLAGLREKGYLVEEPL